jgi:DNA-binding MarR family transcriptional regulator/GNAT superfamily N-acetyltransferase
VAPAHDQAVEAVRRFNRFYTKQIGLLREGLLDTPFSLTQARVVYEIGRQKRITSKQLGEGLNLDAGYLSRQIGKFERDGLLVRQSSGQDARIRHLALTRKGRAAFAMLDQRSASDVRDQLRALPPAAQARLVGSMNTIQGLLETTAEPPEIDLRAHKPGDMGWVIMRHGAIYAEEYGWDATFEALVADIAAKFIRRFDPQCERCWIAEFRGERVGCVFLVKGSRAVAKLRLLLVEPTARGLGAGSLLVGECLSFARAAGYRKVTLWTNDILHAARRIYQRAGFRLIYEDRHHSFGHDLVGQNWELTLATGKAE